MKLKNRTMVIMGGMGGIATAIINKFIAEGACVVAADLKMSELSKEKVNFNYDHRLLHCRADITKIEDLERVKELCNKEYGIAEILINAAAIQSPIGPFCSVDYRDWANNINVNLLGTVLAAKVFLQDFIKGGKGKIINFAGGGSTSPRINFSAYGVAKTAVIRFTETIAEELRPLNIQVYAVSPGVIKTNMIDEILGKREKDIGAEYAQLKMRMTTGFDSPDTVVNLIVYLAANGPDWATGKTISAIWDPWMNWQDSDEREEMPDLYVLRRIDGRKFVKR